MTQRGIRRLKDALRLGRALHLVWQSGPGWTLLRCVFVFFQGLLPVVTLYLLKLVLDAVSLQLKSPGPEHLNQITWFISLMAATALANSLITSLEGLVSVAHSQIVTDHMSGILLTRSIAADLDYYENSEYYDKFHRAQQEANFRPSRILTSLVQASRDTISLCALGAVIVSFHWALAIVLLVAFLPGLLVRLRSSRLLYDLEREKTSTERKAAYFNMLLTIPYCAKEVRLYGLGPLLLERFSALRKKLAQARLQIAGRRCVWESVTQMGSTLAIYGSYGFMAYRTVEGAITVGALVMYYQVLQRGQTFLRELLTAVGNLYEDNLFLASLDEFLNLESKIVAPPHPKPVPSPLARGIAFEGVTFRYPSGQRTVLENLNFTINRGQIVAFVGENGAGKTTLIKLLCRLYDPTVGRITWDGIDAREFDPAELRRQIGVVFQDYACYHMTASENIWFGDVQKSQDQAPIEEAARMSGAYDVITPLSRGFNSMLGKYFDEGNELSIGQWQKIALARAYFRAAPVIVLDEPTSALDPKAEYAVFESMRQLAHDRTTILISHRFSTVKMADCIHVIEAGRITESGSHDELVKRAGMYAKLFETQAQYYR